MFSSLPAGAIQSLVKLAGEIRTAFRKDEIMMTVSPRTLVACCSYMTMGADLKQAVMACIVAKASRDDLAKVSEVVQRLV